MCLRFAEMQFSFWSLAYKWYLKPQGWKVTSGERVEWEDVRTCKSERSDGRGGIGEVNRGGTASEEENRRACYWGGVCRGNGLRQRAYMWNAAARSSKARTGNCPLDSATQKMQEGWCEPWDQKASRNGCRSECTGAEKMETQLFMEVWAVAREGSLTTQY